MADDLDYSEAVGGAAPVNPRPPSAGGGAVFFMVLLASLGWRAAGFGLLLRRRGRCPRKPLPAVRARGRGVFHSFDLWRGPVSGCLRS